MGKKDKKRSVKPAPKTTTKPVQKEKRSFWPWFLLLAVITAVCFFPMMKNTFTNWDDEFYVVNNALLRGPDWAGIFSKQVVSNYHPLTILSLALNYAISGTQAWSYLALNLLLHIINVTLVFKFIYSISDKKFGVAFFSALIFAIHPMHVESVAWISERKDVLYTLFFLLSLMQYWRFLQTNKQKYLWVCFLLFVFSLLSKPAAIVLPLVLFLLDHWKQRQFSKKIIWEKIPFFLVAGLFTVITLKLQSVTAMTSLDQYPIWVRLFFACYVTMIYFIRFFVPYPLSAFHPFPSPDNLGWVVYLSPIFVLAFLFFLWRYRKNRVVVFGLLFFIVNILLVLQLISIGYTIVSERYTYVPYIGLAFLLLMLVNKYAATKAMTALRAVAAIVFLVFGFMSFQRTKVWKDSQTMWTDVIDRYPNASLARGDRAQYNYNRAILMDPKQAEPLLKSVIEDCSVVINLSKDTLKSGHPKAGRSFYFMRGVSYNSLQQFDKAFEDFTDCIEVDPNDDEVINARGSLSVNYYKKYPEAMNDFNRAIQINPKGNYYLNRSICYYKMGDLVKAKDDAQTAIQKGVNVMDSYRKLLNL